MNKNKFLSKKDIKNIIYVSLSAFIYAFYVVNFATPAKTYPGGMAGISRLTSDILMDNFNTPNLFALIYGCLNAIAFYIVFKKIGKKFIILTLIQVLLTTFFSQILPRVIFVDDILLSSVFGGIVGGFGITLALNHNSCSGGLDLFAVYFSNKFKKPIFTQILFINVCILTIASLIYGWEKGMYSIIMQFCTTEVINKLHQRYTYQTLNIITLFPNEVTKHILDNCKHGITKINVVGAYNNEDKTMLMMVVNTFETNEIIQYVLKIDPKAFILINDSNRVVGNYTQRPLD